MGNYKRVYSSFICVLTFSVLVVDVNSGHADSLREAFSKLPLAVKAAFKALWLPFGGGDPIESLIGVAKCIQDKTSGLNLCNFDTSYDPFYYLQECANGTLVQKFIEGFVKNIPVAKFNFGIPNKISKDRCFRFTSLIPGISAPDTSIPGISAPEISLPGI